MRRIITLTTDFGAEDGYVGTIKGVILGINPEAVLVDLCHNVAPQDVAEAAFILATSHKYFPSNTIHLAVVDPGVGGNRRAIIVEGAEGVFVGPDNGVLSWAASGILDRIGAQGMVANRLTAVNISNPKYWQPHISRTFHARDIFAPVVAHLSLGVPLCQFGDVVDGISRLPLPTPEVVDTATLVAHVIHVDRFGNLITDLSQSEVERLGGDVALEIVGQRIPGLSEHYAATAGLMALLGSSGLVEIAVRDGSAARFRAAGKGDRGIGSVKRGL